jgi:hypothetical protein
MLQSRYLGPESAMVDTAFADETLQFGEDPRPIRQTGDPDMGGKRAALGVQRLHVQVVGLPHARRRRRSPAQFGQGDP